MQDLDQCMKRKDIHVLADEVIQDKEPAIRMQFPDLFSRPVREVVAGCDQLL
jgi:hypothetical protein